MELKYRFYLLIPREAGGFACLGNAADQAELGAQAQLLADVHTHSLICQCVEVFTSTDSHVLPKAEPDLTPIEKYTDDKKSRKKTKGKAKSSRRAPPPTPTPSNIS